MRWPFTLRNSSVNIIEKNWPSAGVDRPFCGSIAEAKPIPIDVPISSLAIIGAAKAICRTKPIANPTSASAATDRMVVSENTAIGGMTGWLASTSTPIAPDSETRTVSGTDTALNTGAAMNAAPTRTITNSSAHSGCSIERPKPSGLKVPLPLEEGRTEG